MQLFQGKDHAGHRRVERGRQAGAGAAGNQVSFLHAGSFRHTAESLADDRPQLHGWAFTAKRQSGADGQYAAQKLAKQDF